MNMQESGQDVDSRDESFPDDFDAARRGALAKLGAFAALSGSAVTTLLISNKATAQSTTVGGGAVPASGTVDPQDPGSTSVCIGGGDTC